MNIEKNTDIKPLEFKPISRKEFNLKYAMPYIAVYLITLAMTQTTHKSSTIYIFDIIMFLITAYCVYGTVIRVRSIGYVNLWVAIPLALFLMLLKITFIWLMCTGNDKTNELLAQYNEENPEYNGNYFK